MYQDSVALIIGVSKYKSPGWDNLDVVPEEVELVKSVLEEQKFQTRIVLDPDSETLLKEIRTFLKQKRGRDTRLVLYYAGHGFTSKQDRMGFIVPADAPEEHDDEFLEKVISMQEIKSWLPNGRAKHILLVFDSCFSGFIFKLRKNSRPVPDDIYLNDIDRPGRQFITSGEAHETVPDRLDFAEAFADGIRGNADYNIDGLVTVSELGYHLKKVVKPRGLQSPQYGVDPGDSDTKTAYAGNMVFVKPNSTDGVGVVRLASSEANGPRIANLRGLGVPENMAASVFHRVEVLYYRKLADQDVISEALENDDIPYSVTSAELPDAFETNGIACGPDVPVAALKRLAHSLIEAGVPIRKIIRFKRPSEKPRRLEVMSLTAEGRGLAPLDTPPLTVEQIEALTSCPTSLHN